MFKDSLIHGLKVAGHILGSIALVVVGYYLFDPAGLTQLQGFLAHYGLPVGLVNILIAMAVNYYKSAKS